MQLHLSGCHAHAHTLAHVAGVPAGALGSEGPFAAVPQARLLQGSQEGQTGLLTPAFLATLASQLRSQEAAPGSALLSSVSASGVAVGSPCRRQACVPLPLAAPGPEFPGSTWAASY